MELCCLISVRGGSSLLGWQCDRFIQIRIPASFPNASWQGGGGKTSSLSGLRNSELTSRARLLNILPESKIAQVTVGGYLQTSCFNEFLVGFIKKLHILQMKICSSCSAGLLIVVGLVCFLWKSDP